MGLAVYKIVADGKDITNVIRPLFLSININDEAGRDSDSFTLRLFDDGKIAYPQTEATIEVYTGKSQQALSLRGVFTVNSVKLTSAERTIELSGDAANLSGEFKNQRDYTWEQTNLKQLVEAVAERCGYIPAVAEQYASVTIAHRNQTGQSDADLLTELAEENNATMKVKQKTLIFFPRGDNQTVSGSSLSSVPVHLTDEVDATITLSGAGKFKAVTARWHDADAAETKTVRVGESQGRAKQLNTSYPNEAAAKAAAESALHDLKRAEYTLELDEFPFIPSLMAERNISLSGHHRAQFNGEWMCESLSETLDESGHVMSGTFVAPKRNIDEIPRLSN
ncbi:phage late control D family protein [Vibrio sp. ER1A]|uniref:phage late control D family protein n=1 Tax=Vibrio sp. ER1A TaxID=1517681 RepID=UPI0004DD4D1B|nr:contractile injection system protein, VgrG/Pvc8 family [Vibrio sp. ER1A]KFA98770.1 hypothetical protein HW45_07020 [Vibrio sp. ER1A]